MKHQIICETAFTHEGDLNYLKKQIDIAKDINSDYIKFQILLDIDSVYSRSTEIYHDMKTKMLSETEWEDAIEYATNIGLKTLVLPIDYHALKFALNNKSTHAIEIHSICLNDIVFLDEINKSKTDLLIVLGIGGRKIKEINFCINYLESKNLLLMAGFQSFPTNIEDANLGKIKTLKTEYSYPIGYADHTQWDKDDSSMILTALALGALYIEKHIILEKGSERADYYSAVGKDELIKLQETVGLYKKIYGKEDLNILNNKELIYKNRERKIIATTDIKEGSVFDKSNIGYSVTNQETDIEQYEYNSLLSKSAKNDIKKGSIIMRHNIK